MKEKTQKEEVEEGEEEVEEEKEEEENRKEEDKKEQKEEKKGKKECKEKGKKKRKGKEEKLEEVNTGSYRSEEVRTRTLHQKGAEGEETFLLRKLIGALDDCHHVINFH